MAGAAQVEARLAMLADVTVRVLRQLHRTASHSLWLVVGLGGVWPAMAGAGLPTSTVYSP